MTGLWLCKDFIRVARDNSLIESEFGGEYYYREVLVFANCQQFDLTADRGGIKNDQEEYDFAIDGIKKFVKDMRNDPFVKDYRDTRKKEFNQEKIERDVKKDEEIKKQSEQRLNEYKGRPDLKAPKVVSGPIKEPKSEAETALLLQAMISSKHPGIDFRIGEYNTWKGTDLLVEYKNKGMPSLAWAEIVATLQKLFEWSHPPEGIHKVICWELGNVSEKQTFVDGQEANLIKKGPGRYLLNVGVDSIEVYVLREII